MRKIIAVVFCALAFQAQAANFPAGHKGTLHEGHTFCYDDYSWRDMALAIDTKDEQMINHLKEGKKCAQLTRDFEYTVLDYSPYYFYYKARVWQQGNPYIIYTTIPNQS